MKTKNLNLKAKINVSYSYDTDDQLFVARVNVYLPVGEDAEKGLLHPLLRCNETNIDPDGWDTQKENLKACWGVSYNYEEKRKKAYVAKDDSINNLMVRVKEFVEIVEKRLREVVRKNEIALNLLPKEEEEYIIDLS
ncbi:MAG TPA: hypothetical protein PLK41_08725 [Defluviitoga tunisiensis]|nr:hypothetical protein [Defluviitoga tunisiensis]HPP11057.1 hypothetical protein [Defluviitoga tunisiensis]